MSASAASRGLMLCLVCEQLNRPAAGAAHHACARCGAAIHWRKPASYLRAWMFLVLACILYVPANTLPVMESGTLFGSTADTIMSGVAHLWHTGSWVLAVIIFVASIMLPGAKLASLGYLLYAAQQRWTTDPGQRARLYRTMAFVGRWSMVDIFVGAVLVAVVQFRTVASVEPRAGAIAFALVVIFTMLASMSFDPRLTWDAAEQADG